MSFLKVIASLIGIVVLMTGGYYIFTATLLDNNPAETAPNPTNTRLNPKSAARDQARIADLKSLETVLVSYYHDNGEYPSRTAKLVTSEYLIRTLVDPRTNQAYYYEVHDDGQGFSLRAEMENCEKANTSDCQYEIFKQGAP